MTQPTLENALRAASLAVSAHQYCEEYTPDDWDGDATYHNEAFGELIELTQTWSDESLETLAVWSESHASEVTETLRQMKLGARQ